MEHKWEVIQTDPLNPTSKIIWGHNRGHNRGHGSKSKLIKLSKFKLIGYQMRLL